MGRGPQTNGLPPHRQRRITTLLIARGTGFHNCMTWLRSLERQGHTHAMMAEECAALGVPVSEYTVAKWLQSDRRARGSERLESATV